MKVLNIMSNVPQQKRLHLACLGSYFAALPPQLPQQRQQQKQKPTMGMMMMKRMPMMMHTTKPTKYSVHYNDTINKN